MASLSLSLPHKHCDTTCRFITQYKHTHTCMCTRIGAQQRTRHSVHTSHTRKTPSTTASPFLPVSSAQWRSLSSIYCALDESVVRVSPVSSSSSPSVVSSWLQGVMTADVRDIESSGYGYSVFLNFKGRTVFDAVVVSHGAAEKPQGSFLLCVSNAVFDKAVDHMRKLNFRHKVNIDKQQAQVWSVIDMRHKNNAHQLAHTVIEVTQQQLPHTQLTAFPDPRSSSLGVRVIAPRSTLSLPSPFVCVSPIVYEAYRILHGIPVVGSDLLPDKSLPLECNLDHLHGISFNKGCYVGQEVTARGHYQGTIRKRLYSAYLTQRMQHTQTEEQHADNSQHHSSLFPEPFFNPLFPSLPSDLPVLAITAGDAVSKQVGQLCSVYANLCIALLRTDPVFNPQTRLFVLHEGVEYDLSVNKTEYEDQRQDERGETETKISQQMHKATAVTT